jgi:hypothetical protein
MPEGDFSWIKSGRFQEVLKCHAEVFPVRKSSISDIAGFPAVDRDHSLTFLTVYKDGQACTTLIKKKI